MVNSNTRTIVFIGAILILLYILYINRDTTVPSTTISSQPVRQEPFTQQVIDETELKRMLENSGLEDTNRQENVDVDVGEKIVCNTPVMDDNDSWKNFFNQTRDIISASRKPTDGTFKPNLETDPDLGSYSPKIKTVIPSRDFIDPMKERDLDEADMFDVDSLLPNEKHNWFDVIEDTLPVKGKNLIDTQKYIGVNTVGSTKKNASLDLRGNVATPKFQVSVWNNSTIEPDFNIKSWC